jgi:hypothetical protein
VPFHCQKELQAQGKNPEDSNLASVEAMQWVLLSLSIGLGGY